ncbi:high-affinity iron permease [Actinomortierella wolfii]|nr:high-affinity iron permease [Actinomortierella wolfii]KAG0225068.1 high-affinity iron permease [Actinomortierella wolfii]
MGAADYFSIPIFFIIFRETTEAAIIVSVLLSFLHQVLFDDPVMRKRLARQVWAGTGIGLLISLAIGMAFIYVWNVYGANLWASSEGIWVGCFSFVAVVMITVMGIAMLRTNQMQEKWKVKLAKAMDDENDRGLGNKSRKYALFILPLITVLREGLEAVVFIGGVTFTEKMEAIPAAVIVGVLIGCLVGLLLYRGGNSMNLHPFFVGSTCLLMLIAAGLVSKGIQAFESYVWGILTDAQSDDGGTYDPRINVWALKCCDPKQPDAGGWALFNAILGWSNIASYFSIGGYILYWVVVIVSLVHLKRKRNVKRSGENQPLLRPPSPSAASLGEDEGLLASSARVDANTDGIQVASA